MDFLENVRENYDELPFIMFTEKGDEKVAAQAINAGVTNYIPENEYQKVAETVENEINNQERPFNDDLPGIDNSPIGVTITKMKDNEGNREIVYVNDSFEDLTGYSTEEILGEDCRILQGEDTDSKSVQEIREALNNEESVETQLLNYTKEGEEFWNRVSIAPYPNEQGETEYFFGYQINVTDEVEYRQNLELILSIISHDFRNDLSIIEGNMELLKQNENLENKQIKVIENRLDAMENSLEDINIVKKNMKGFENQNTILNDKLDAIVDDYIAEAELNGFSINVEDVEGDYFVESPVFLDQYFGNMFENSIEHSNGDQIEVSYEATDDEVKITVSDNGQGMNTDRENWGTGMFLINAIAKQSDLDLSIDGENGVTFESTFDLIDKDKEIQFL